MSCLIEMLEDDGILHLVLNVPEKKNALTDDLRAAFRDATLRAQTDAGVRAILISGAGGAFCSGGDIAAMTGDPEIAQRRMQVLHDVVKLLIAGTKPTVAAVGGVAFGAGFSLALCCDQVVADTSARFSASFGRVGLPPDLALSFTLPRRTGDGIARRMLLSSTILDAAEAAKAGIVDDLTQPDDLLDRARAAARDLAGFGQESKAHVKALVTAAAGDLDALLAREMSSYLALLNSPEHVAARTAFMSRSGKT
ncbi:enoyl-CoA hydratase/isomerase family protein [Chachezhania sediminis]|uniref:enoyl-CoA hydratase/isomerase family protein n=1 Tax=Chachezhania sediminis TaxID=2599291 RepID=UPI00131CB12E|nr:enoyl-CoA hydratase-related protein [Chachezhania sediminis]